MGPPGPAVPAVSPRGHGRRVGVVAVLVVVLVASLVSGLLVWAPWKPPATPTGLTVTSRTPTTITLSWAPRSTGTPVGRYVIVRNNSEVGSVTGSETSFVDSGLTPGGSYSYEVVAARGSKRSAPQAHPATANTTAPSPSALKQLAATPESVTIGWAPPADSPTPDEYMILSATDGTQLATTFGDFGSSGPAYQITGLDFGSTYSVQVEAVWSAGGHSQPSSALEVTTSNPPVSQARLDNPDGASVKFTVTASTFTNLPVGKTFTNTWFLTPTCQTGPCNVTLDGNFHETADGVPFQLTLTRHGAVYTGQTKAELSQCGSIKVSDTVKVTITVKAAGGPDWTASRWVGTIEDDSPYTDPGGAYYCPAGKTIASISSAGAPAT